MGRRGIKNGFKLKDHQLSIDWYMQKRLYTNQMVTIYQKTVINMQKNKEKEIHLYHERKSAKHKREKDKKELEKILETTTNQIIK